MEDISFSLNLFCFGFLTDVGQEVQPVGRVLPGACPSSVRLCWLYCCPCGPEQHSCGDNTERVGLAKSVDPSGLN